MSNDEKFDGVKVKVTAILPSYDGLSSYADDRGEFKFDSFETADAFASQYVESAAEYVEVQVYAYYKSMHVKKPEPAKQIPEE